LHWASKYVGLPYKGGGRTRDGLDCYGLLALVMLEQFGIRLETFDGLDGAVGEHDGEHAERVKSFWDDRVGSEWEALSLGDETAGDAVNMIVYRRPHCGVVTGAGNMLHIRPGMDAVIEPYTRGWLCRRVESIYRHRQR